MIIVYYSRNSPWPALLASMRHCRPALLPEQAWREAAAWMKANYCPGGQSYFLKRFGESSGGDTIYLMSSVVPALFLKRTLNGLLELTGSGGQVLLAAIPLYWKRRWEYCSSGRKRACWMEIEALVERTRLQVELVKRR
jgi:hypothetical protein